jgi:hypothetical protein
LQKGFFEPFEKLFFSRQPFSSASLFLRLKPINQPSLRRRNKLVEKKVAEEEKHFSNESKNPLSETK